MTYVPNNIRGVLFDMDGTLVDSERQSEQAMLALLTERGRSTDGLDLVQFHGVAWKQIAARLLALYPGVGAGVVQLAGDIEAGFQHLFVTTPPDIIPGALEAFAAAAAAFPGATTIVTGSEARAVENLLDRTDLHELCTGYTSCDQYQKSKPDPQSYLVAADRLGVAPESCLVFEDSRAGLMAARAAGMCCIAITRGVPERVRQAAELADDAIDDFRDLPDGFFASAAQPGKSSD